MQLVDCIPDNGGFAAIRTNDGLTVALVAWPIEEFETNRRDLLGNYLAAFKVGPQGRGRRP